MQNAECRMQNKKVNREVAGVEDGGGDFFLLLYDGGC